MNSYKAIIVDDEYNLREVMNTLLTEYCPQIAVCGTAASAEEARGLLRKQQIDLIFLDISMPQEDGFSFLQSIESENYAIIFVTAYQEYALKAIRASAVDYLLKPVNANELVEAVDKAIHYLMIRRQKKEARLIYEESLSMLDTQLKAASKPIEKITVPEQFGFQIVKVCDIMYLEADSNYTILHFSGLSKIVATRSLGDFAKILEGPDFFRIHKSTLINLRFLKAYNSYQGNFAELTDGTRLNISRRKIQEFKEAVSHISKLVE
jgi:two-component system, LytTR family, response regulator